MGINQEGSKKEVMQRDGQDCQKILLSISPVFIKSLTGYRSSTQSRTKKKSLGVGVRCKVCQQTFMRTNSSTLKTHLKVLHPEIFKAVESKSVSFKFSPVSVSDYL